MISINLIRWRSQVRKRCLLQLTLNCFVAILLVAWFVWSLFIEVEGEVTKELLAFNALNQEYLLLNNTSLLGKHTLTTERLQASQHHYSLIENNILSHQRVTRLFEMLQQILPEPLVLSELKFDQQTLWIKGISLSNPAITHFLQRLSLQSQYQQPKVNVSLQGNTGSNRLLETKGDPQQLKALDVVIKIKPTNDGAL